MEKGHGSREGGGAFMSTLIIKILKFSVEQSRVVTTLNLIKH